MSWTARFLPEDRGYSGSAPVPLAAAAAACDILLEQPCGGRGTCGRCRVRVLTPSEPHLLDRAVLGEEDVADGWRLGCRLLLHEAARIELPYESRAVTHKSFGDDDLLTPGFTAIASDGLGIALDIGSTTLAAAVVELGTGAVLASATALNPQTGFGADIMSRLAYALRRAEGASELHDALVAGVNRVVAEALAQSASDVACITHLAIVGNPSMLHSLQALPLDGLALAPFQGARYHAHECDAIELGIQLPQAKAYLLPGVHAHVGADAVAAALATALDRCTRPTLLLDLGTNTELLLATPAALLCTSAAAGPAFEGAAIACGMRASPGAIDRVQLSEDGDVLLHVLGDAPPAGLCGSGLVDAVAELLLAGIVTPAGRMLAAHDRPPSLPLHLAQRLEEWRGQRAFRLSDAGDAVVLAAADVRELQLVKGSIGAGITLLLQHAGLRVDDIDEVLLAGAFGSYLRGSSAQALGLIPGVPPDRVRFVGNAAGVGARLALVDREARERARSIATSARFIELAGRPEYQDAFAAALGFPVPEPGA